MGPRKRKHLGSLILSPPPRRSSRDAGNCATLTGGMNDAEVTRQNGVPGKASCHQSRQRSNVRRLTPTTWLSLLSRAAVIPWRIAETSTTTAPK